MSPEDAAYLKSQGWSDAEIANAIPVDSQNNGGNISNSQAISNTLKAHAGGIVGGGAGGIGGGALAGTMVEPGLGTIVGAILGGLAGSYGGQKAQQAIEPSDIYNAQQLAAQQSSEQHPLISGATDIIASSLASGGKPSLSGIKDLLAGDLSSDAAKGALLQAGFNPAIQAGTSIASGQGLPSLGELAGSAAGGALFSKSWLPHSNNIADEPTSEVNNNTQEQPTEDNTNAVQENEETLNHGDEVHATMPDGSEVKGHVMGVDPKDGNPQIITEDKKIITLPENTLTPDEQKEIESLGAVNDIDKVREDSTPIQEEPPKEENANTITSPVETVRSETPGTTAPVAEGKSSELQEPTKDSTTQETKLPTKEQIATIGSNDDLQKGYDKYNNQAKTSMASGEFQKGVDEATTAQWHREELERRINNKVQQETNLPIGGKLFRNAVDTTHKVAPEVSDAAHKFLNERQQINGDVYGQVKNVMEKEGFTKQDGDRLMEAMMQEERTFKPVPMSFFRNNAQRAVWNKWKEVYKQQGANRIEDKQPVIDAKTGQPRLLKPNETSHPIMINPKVVDTIRANKDTGAIGKLKEDFIKDQISRDVKEEDAQKNLDTIISAIQGKPISRGGATGNLNYFNANRRAQGIPLPKSWSRTDFEQNLKAFSFRNAADRAFFRNIESNPSVMWQLGETHNSWNEPLPESNKPIVAGNSAVRALINSFHGDLGSTMQHNEEAISHLTTSLFIASPALSGVHIPIANIVGAVGLAHNPVEAGKMLVNGIKNINKGVIEARNNGFRVDAGNANTMLDANLNAAERLHGVASLVRKISTFNDLITKGTIGYTQSMMDVLVPSKIIRANAGDKTAQQWLRNLDPEYSVGRKYTSEQISQLATRAAGTIHGTSDARTMPAWMLHDNEISGFLSLAHWSVGQTDRFMKDIYTPATKGDYKPLLTTIFGAVAGGYLIKKLREDISGKKSQIPSINEIAAGEKGLEGNIPLVAYNMIAAMQYAGFGGLYSQIAKYPFDIAYKNKPQGATFPLDEIATDIAETLNNVGTTLSNDPNVNWVDLAQAVGGHMLTSNFRLGREAYNQAIDHGLIDGMPAEKKQLADKLGQLRRFDIVEGLPYNEIDSAGNPFMNLEQKKFKLEQNLPNAIGQIPELVSNIIKNYSDKPDVMMSKLKALKQNDYAIFPSLEDAPLSFSKYLSYLNKEEGPEAARDALTDYLKHKTINQIKSSIVP